MPTPDALRPLRDLAALLTKAQLRFVLVGAGARVLLLDEPLGLTNQRFTEDWDLGILAASWEEVQRLKTLLLDAGFRTSSVEHRFRHPQGVPMDIVPFGGVEQTPGLIRWPVDEQEMCVLGFAEALETAGIRRLDGVLLPVASIPMQAVLKSFAFNERQDADDLRDLFSLLRHGAEDRMERCFTELNGPLARGDLGFEAAGAALLGLDAGRALRPATREALLPILATLADPTFPALGQLIHRLGDEADEQRRLAETARRFRAFAQGLRLGAG